MAVLLIKITVIFFFGFIAYDAFKKASKHRRNAENDRFNRNVLEVLARKERRNGILYSVIILLAFAAIFIKP